MLGVLLNPSLYCVVIKRLGIIGPPLTDDAGLYHRARLDVLP